MLVAIQFQETKHAPFADPCRFFNWVGHDLRSRQSGNCQPTLGKLPALAAIGPGRSDAWRSVPTRFAKDSRPHLFTGGMK